MKFFEGEVLLKKRGGNLVFAKNRVASTGIAEVDVTNGINRRDTKDVGVFQFGVVRWDVSEIGRWENVGRRYRLVLRKEVDGQKSGNGKNFRRLRISRVDVEVSVTEDLDSKIVVLYRKVLENITEPEKIESLSNRDGKSRYFRGIFAQKGYSRYGRNAQISLRKPLRAG